MTDRLENEGRDDADGHTPADEAAGETGILPSIDPIGQPHDPPLEQAEPDVVPEAPPLDIDERDAGVSHAHPPDVIELPDHADAPAPDPGLLERPLDNEFQPLALEDDVDNQSSLAPDSDGSGSGPAQTADELHWVPSGEPVAGTAPDPTFERIYDETDESLIEETGSPAGRFVHAEDKRDDGGSSRGAGFLAGLGAAVKSARSATTGKESSGAHGAAEKTGGDETNDGGILGMFRGNSAVLDPTLHASSTMPHRMVLTGGAVIILLSLMSNNAGLALIVASAIVPVSIALTLNQQDVFEKESTLLTTAVGASGMVIGAIFALLSTWLVTGNWFDNGVLNYGAAGFGGRFADLAGTAPFVVWFVNGLLLPLLGLGAIAAVPIAMRRWPQFRNEVMDGVILCGTSAAGFAVGTAIVFWAPMISDEGPQTSVADWTLTTLGVVLLRPIVITLAGAMLGAGIWKYMLTSSVNALILPALASIGGILLLTFGSLQLQPSGLWPEVVWTLLIAIASFVVYRLVLDSAISSDRKVIDEDQARVVCPNCRKITPAGAFCAHCGAVLEQTGAAAAT